MTERTPLLQDEESTGAAAVGTKNQEPVERALRMVLLGKTGVGKSATGNTILRKKVFKSSYTSSSRTLECVKKTGAFEDQSLAVMDTPGLFNTNLEERKVMAEITNCISLSGSGPHVFLVVIQPNRFTREDEETVKIIRNHFGEESVRYSMVLFTHGDDLEDENQEDEDQEDEDCSIDNIIENNDALHDIVTQCGGGYHVFNNRNNDPSQVRELLEKINRMFHKNGGSYYTKEMLEEAQRIKREELRIVLVGKTGAGKSAAGNTILGEKIFTYGIYSSSVTSKCEKKTGAVNGRVLSVVDTPGIFDTFKDEQQVKTEIAKCVSLIAPGPHVFLVVIQPGRFTEEEQNTVKIIQEIFGADSKDYILVLFTHGDDLKEENVPIKNIIDGHKALKNFIDQCGKRYHVFNNKAKDPAQVRELIKKIDKMVKKHGGKEKYYTNQMLQAAEEAIKEEMEKLQKENPNMADDEARRKAEKDNSFIRGVLASAGIVVGTTAAGIITDVAIGAAFGSVAGPIGAAVGLGVGLLIAATVVVVKKKKFCKVQ